MPIISIRAVRRNIHRQTPPTQTGRGLPGDPFSRHALTRGDFSRRGFCLHRAGVKTHAVRAWGVPLMLPLGVVHRAIIRMLCGETILCVTLLRRTAPALIPSRARSGRSRTLDGSQRNTLGHAVQGGSIPCTACKALLLLSLSLSLICPAI
ncbi:hypothetical protein [Glaciimonas sp. PAMC28666]|uniref:hypothetical protein n=1 Tax=Glaciimonas sp. PAMC28666 TaxID=2807626 RepID=UPI001964E59A|nr:hypothetical protein [Glaciimonas sp. PAMC28666]QRX81614.1 hypothetical protein JQN73_15850 [Glaciimonas sp. PAMC28666]QRX81623.1 hypothetical protein JQN73_15895 [Glaciimonas sp. PAMC28666]